MTAFGVPLERRDAHLTPGEPTYSRSSQGISTW